MIRDRKIESELLVATAACDGKRQKKDETFSGIRNGRFNVMFGRFVFDRICAEHGSVRVSGECAKYRAADKQKS